MSIKSYTMLSSKSKELIVNSVGIRESFIQHTIYDLRSTIGRGDEETRDKIWSILYVGNFAWEVMPRLRRL